MSCRQSHKRQDSFCIGNIIEEENKILDCDLDVNGDELENLHSSCVLSKEIQNKFKGEEEAAMDDPWINGVLIEKADVDSPGNWPEFCYRPTFNEKGGYDRHNRQQVQNLFLLITKVTELMMDGIFITMDGKAKKAYEMEQEELFCSLHQGRGR
eukprot:10908824-Ditylum_brightwellii.AAC.1